MFAIEPGTWVFDSLSKTTEQKQDENLARFKVARFIELVGSQLPKFIKAVFDIIRVELNRNPWYRTPSNKESFGELSRLVKKSQTLEPEMTINNMDRKIWLPFTLCVSCNPADAVYSETMENLVSNIKHG